MALRGAIQIIFQNPYASLNPRFTVGQILTEPMKIHGIGANDAGAHRAARSQLLEQGRAATAASFYKYPHEFSGGQRQRIAIARCLTMKPDVLICDESVSALDVSVQAQVLNLLQDLQDEFGMSYIFISHDLAVVKYIADDMMVMNAGRDRRTRGLDAIYAALRTSTRESCSGAFRADTGRAGRRQPRSTRPKRLSFRLSGRKLTDALGRVIALRAELETDADSTRWAALKQWQIGRLRERYADLLAHPCFKEAANFSSMSCTARRTSISATPEFKRSSRSSQECCRHVRSKRYCWRSNSTSWRSSSTKCHANRPAGH